MNRRVNNVPLIVLTSKVSTIKSKPFVTFSDFPSSVRQKLCKISKYIIFHTENLNFYESGTLQNGMSYTRCSFGEQGKDLIYFILYIDMHDDLSAYIPINGNTIHPKFKAVWGRWKDSKLYKKSKDKKIPKENPYTYDDDRFKDDIENRFRN